MISSTTTTSLYIWFWKRDDEKGTKGLRFGGLHDKLSEGDVTNHTSEFDQHVLLGNSRYSTMEPSSLNHTTRYVLEPNIGKLMQRRLVTEMPNKRQAPNMSIYWHTSIRWYTKSCLWTGQRLLNQHKLPMVWLLIAFIKLLMKNKHQHKDVCMWGRGPEMFYFVHDQYIFNFSTCALTSNFVCMSEHTQRESQDEQRHDHTYTFGGIWAAGAHVRAR